MIVSTSNFSKEATITVVPESLDQDIYTITDGDYSSSFSQSMTGETTISFVFPTPRDIGYIAIGGSNISRKDNIKITSVDTSERIQLVTADALDVKEAAGLYIVLNYDNTIDDSNLGLDESEVMMYQLDIPQSQRLEFTVTGTGTLLISEIAIGAYYEIPGGEQAGYSRPWSKPNIKGRSSTSLNASPINLSYESAVLSSSITVPNNIMADFDGWYNFIKFASSNTFYVLEDDNKFHSYAGFNMVADMTAAHAQTRKLGASTVKFNAYSKSTEALFS